MAKPSKSPLADLLHPRRFSGMSPRMTAIVAYILGEKWTDPQITEMAVTSDGFVMAQNSGDVGMNNMIGSQEDLMSNWRRLLHAAGLTEAQRKEAMGLFRKRITKYGDSAYVRRSRPNPTGAKKSYENPIGDAPYPKGFPLIEKYGNLRYVGFNNLPRDTQEKLRARWSPMGQGAWKDIRNWAFAVKKDGSLPRRRTPYMEPMRSIHDPDVVASLKRPNPSIGPVIPHTWVTKKGVHVSGGDTIEYLSNNGLPLMARPERRRAKVNRMLVFNDHVMVSRGPFGDYVDDDNFVRVVRRANPTSNEKACDRCDCADPTALHDLKRECGCACHGRDQWEWKRRSAGPGVTAFVGGWDKKKSPKRSNPDIPKQVRDRVSVVKMGGGLYLVSGPAGDFNVRWNGEDAMWIVSRRGGASMGGESSRDVAIGQAKHYAAFGTGTRKTRRAVDALSKRSNPRRFRVDKRGVEYVARGQRAPSGWATCGHCGRSWNDEKVTSVTPTPSGRCPFEDWHTYGRSNFERND